MVDTAKSLADLQAKGLIKHVGLTNMVRGCIPSPGVTGCGCGLTNMVFFSEAKGSGCGWCGCDCEIQRERRM